MSVAAYIAEVLARPEVVEARRETRLVRRRVRRVRKTPAAPVAPRPITHFNVKGTWTAEEVEPHLASPRSSLNPAFVLGEDL
jgi:hypothetical protein